MTQESQELREISEELDRVVEDDTVPQNIRNSIEDAQEHLLNEDVEVSERAASAINVLNDISNDRNLPMYARTLIWNISSRLETLTME
ncbi:MAG: UPF0147 family protein [Halobacteria archaeon]|nr:UPF0147 family protein [Halobacteria archaeon]